MFPQTHIYFAEWITGTKGDPVTLGSVFPDMLMGGLFNHYESHSKGEEIYNFLKKHNTLLSFGTAVLTHGFVPKGLDYYGDEKYLDFEKGYCFEKAKPFIQATMEACNIPASMGWWKAHNIVEMGIEMLISSRDYYNDRLKSTFANRVLICEVDEMLNDLWIDNGLNFTSRVAKFADVIEQDKADAESLAKKYRLQMLLKHKVEIDTRKVAILIDKAALSVDSELDEFFTTTSDLVKNNISTLTQVK
ncbi:MAG: hypothetical protein PHT62_04750 [Desulfotomaculaceae bacterium]|nr:hypothetical protein [Desulfotomaculaceae bacterium]